MGNGNGTATLTRRAWSAEESGIVEDAIKFAEAHGCNAQGIALYRLANSGHVRTPASVSGKISAIKAAQAAQDERPAGDPCVDAMQKRIAALEARVAFLCGELGVEVGEHE